MRPLHQERPRTRPAAERSRVDITLDRVLPVVEARIGRVLPAPAARFVCEFLAFGIKQAWACLFGGLLLAMILATGAWPDAAPLARYDFLFFFALAVQAAFLATRLERLDEATVILLFHVVGTAMEVFKTAAGSWIYPDTNFFRIGGVPMFSGFMYAAVGSYLSRVVRIHEFEFSRYPPRRWTLLLAAAIYVNFFTHHFAPDVRVALLLAAVVLFWGVSVSFRVWRRRFRMPLLLGFFLVAFFIWIAENVGTAAGAWMYPEQRAGWRLVSLRKLDAWYLLMLISWTLVTVVHAPRVERRR
ncbi:MAG: DUF817 domain-containing protein [Pseudomonadota bacterium]